MEVIRTSICIDGGVPSSAGEGHCSARVDATSGEDAEGDDPASRPRVWANDRDKTGCHPAMRSGVRFGSADEAGAGLADGA